MIASVLRLLCRALFRVEVRGKSNVTSQGKMLVIANHESFLDGMLLGLFLPFRATFVVTPRYSIAGFSARCCV